LDLANNPEEPEFISAGDRKYAHDVYAQDNRMYTSDLSLGFAIVDISDITHPQTLVSQETSFDFTHNAWASGESTYLFTTDERPGAMVDAYDISNADEIVLLDMYRPTATLRNGVIPHNVHYYQGYLVISYYIDGVKIVDAHEPQNLVEVASYDTYRFRDDGFHGAWGAYPFLPSGLLLVSDIESGLYVLQPEYVRASYLSGQVTDSTNAAPLQGVQIKINSIKPGETVTGGSGEFSMGSADTGMVSITFKKSGYQPKELDVNLVREQTTPLNVQLVPLKRYTISGQVLDAASGAPIADAQIVVYSDTYEERKESNSEGKFEIDSYEGNVIIAAGKWGHVHQFIELKLNKDQTAINLILDRGYRDDFVFDYGWSVTNSLNTHESQGWKRGTPKYAIYNEELTNPNGDLENDLGNECFVTGLAGNLGANLADSSILVSPNFDISDYSDPFINYFTWFYDFGVLPSDDSLKIYLGNGETEVLIENISNSLSGWRSQSQIRVLDFLNLSSDMYIKLVASDLGNIHIYEAALDAFSISEGEVTATKEEEIKFGFTTYPNPAKSILNFKMPGQKIDEIRIYDINGKIIFRDATPNNHPIKIGHLRPGTYLLALSNKGKLVGLQKFIKN